MPKQDIFQLAKSQTHRIVLLTVTHNCNLRCRYCYEPNKSCNGLMDFDVARQTIKDYMEKDDRFQLVEFGFFGGEPLLSFDFIKNVVDWFHTQKWRKRHRFFIGTNGTILDERMKKWLIANKECVKIGVSLDGNKSAQDINRSNSFDKVISNLPFFREHWPDQIVKATISAETIPYVSESVIYFEEMEIPFSINLVFENIWGENKTKLLNEYARQLDILVCYYTNHPGLFPARIVGVDLSSLSPNLQDVFGQNRPDQNSRYCGAGHEMVGVEIDGAHYPCHRFSPWITGRKPPIGAVNYHKSWCPDTCNVCRLKVVCPTCIGFNWEVNGDPAIRTTYHCEAFKIQVQASVKLHAQRLLAKNPKDFLTQSKEDIYKTRLLVEGIIEIVDRGTG
jgi:uncharacterized protein